MCVFQHSMEECYKNTCFLLGAGREPEFWVGEFSSFLAACNWAMICPPSPSMPSVYRDEFVAEWLKTTKWVFFPLRPNILLILIFFAIRKWCKMETVQKGVKENSRRSQEERWAACPTLLSRFALHTLSPLATDAYGFAFLSCDAQLAAACMDFETARPLSLPTVEIIFLGRKSCFLGLTPQRHSSPSGTWPGRMMEWIPGPSSVPFPSESEQAGLGTGVGWGSELAPLTITPHRKSCFFLPL